jgi:hypothetical protein
MQWINIMNDIVSTFDRYTPVADQILAVLDFHFHYGVGANQNERDLIKQIDDLVPDHAAVH